MIKLENSIKTEPLWVLASLLIYWNSVIVLMDIKFLFLFSMTRVPFSTINDFDLFLTEIAYRYVGGLRNDGNWAIYAYCVVYFTCIKIKRFCINGCNKSVWPLIEKMPADLRGNDIMQKFFLHEIKYVLSSDTIKNGVMSQLPLLYLMLQSYLHKKGGIYLTFSSSSFVLVTIYYIFLINLGSPVKL